MSQFNASLRMVRACCLCINVIKQLLSNVLELIKNEYVLSAGKPNTTQFHFTLRLFNIEEAALFHAVAILV